MKVTMVRDLPPGPLTRKYPSIVQHSIKPDSAPPNSSEKTADLDERDHEALDRRDDRQDGRG